MFKIGGIENELFQQMEKQLLANQVEAQYGFNKLARAADLLNSAAELFEKAGMHEQANEVTEVLEELTNNLSK